MSQGVALCICGLIEVSALTRALIRRVEEATVMGSIEVW